MWIADWDWDHMYTGSGLVFVQDVVEMARVIEELLADESKFRALSEQGKTFIEKKVGSMAH